MRVDVTYLDKNRDVTSADLADTAVLQQYSEEDELVGETFITLEKPKEQVKQKA